MGVYDTLLINIECPECKILKMRDVQTKDFDCILNHFSVGDVINDAIEESETVGITTCNACNILIYVKCKVKEFKLTDEYEIKYIEKAVESRKCDSYDTKNNSQPTT